MSRQEQAFEAARKDLEKQIDTTRKLLAASPHASSWIFERNGFSLAMDLLQGHPDDYCEKGCLLKEARSVAKAVDSEFELSLDGSVSFKFGDTEVILHSAGPDKRKEKQ